MEQNLTVYENDSTINKYIAPSKDCSNHPKQVYRN